MIKRKIMKKNIIMMMKKNKNKINEG